MAFDWTNNLWKPAAEGFQAMGDLLVDAISSLGNRIMGKIAQGVEGLVEGKGGSGLPPGKADYGESPLVGRDTGTREHTVQVAKEQSIERVNELPGPVRNQVLDVKNAVKDWNLGTSVAAVQNSAYHVYAGELGEFTPNAGLPGSARSAGIAMNA